MKAAILSSKSPQVNERERLSKKYNRMFAENAMKHYEEKYGMNPAKYLLTWDTTATEIRSKQDQELQDLFDQIIFEIEER